MNILIHKYNVSTESNKCKVYVQSTVWPFGSTTVLISPESSSDGASAVEATPETDISNAMGETEDGPDMENTGIIS